MSFYSWFLLGMIAGWILSNYIRLCTVPVHVRFDKETLEAVIKAEKILRAEVENYEAKRRS